MVATALKTQSAYMIDLLKKSMYNTSRSYPDRTDVPDR